MKEAFKSPRRIMADAKSRALAVLALTPLIALAGCGSANNLKLANGKVSTATLTPPERTLSNEAQQNMDQVAGKMARISDAIRAYQFDPIGSTTATTPTAPGEAKVTTWIPAGSIFGTSKGKFDAWELILEAPFKADGQPDFAQPDVVALSDGEVSDSKEGNLGMSTQYTSALFARLTNGSWVFEGDYNSPKSTQTDPSPVMASTAPMSGSMTFTHKMLQQAMVSFDGFFGAAASDQIVGDLAAPFPSTPGDNPVPIKGIF